jgi:hypothetical protein
MPGGIHPPADVFLSWPKPSANPVRRGWDVFVLMVVLYTLALVVVGLRLRARYKRKILGRDDTFIVLAMVYSQFRIFNIGQDSAERA